MGEMHRWRDIYPFKAEEKFLLEFLLKGHDNRH